MAAQEAPQAWHDIVCGTLKANSVLLVVYVPDNVGVGATRARSSSDHGSLHARIGDEGLTMPSRLYFGQM